MRALIFDVDGTLAETEEIHRIAFNETFAAFGLSWFWSVEEYRRLLRTTGGKERIRAYQTSLPQGSHRIDAGAVLALHQHKTRRFAQMVEDGGLALRPGVESLIAEALGWE